MRICIRTPLRNYYVLQYVLKYIKLKENTIFKPRHAPAECDPSFLKLLSGKSVCVFVCVCVFPGLLKTIHVK